MFRKTLIKLTLLNAIMLSCLLGLLGTSVYLYTQHTLNKGVDNELRKASARKIHFGGMPGRNPQEGTIYWDNKNHVIGSRGMIQFDKNDLNKLQPKNFDHIEERKISGIYFRVLSTHVMTKNGLITVENYIIVNTEKNILHTLFMIIITCLIIGVILSLAIGYFLAERALEPIQKSWNKQQQFVSDASHEIRTPLTIIQSRIEMLLQSPQAKIHDKLKDISISLKETRRLSKLVSHLLTLARSDTDQIEIEQSPILINDILKQVVEHFDELVSFQGKLLTLNMTNSPMSILGDKERIYQLFVILIDNAIKFTTENGKINITANLENNNIVLEIIDNGIGISKEHIKSIFDRFFQADPSRTDQEGTGLGLSIAKWIIDKHKGKVLVESELGIGTTFKVIFPQYKALLKEKR